MFEKQRIVPLYEIMMSHSISFLPFRYRVMCSCGSLILLSVRNGYVNKLFAIMNTTVYLIHVLYYIEYCCSDCIPCFSHLGHQDSSQQSLFGHDRNTP